MPAPEGFFAEDAGFFAAGFFAEEEGFFAAGLRAPMALRLMRVGKMNPLDSHPVNKEIETIRKVVKNAEAAAKEEN